MIKTAFYRGMGAYLVGRLFSGSQSIPLALALLHTPQGVTVDSVPVSYTHLRAHETVLDLVCRILLEKTKRSGGMSRYQEETR